MTILFSTINNTLGQTVGGTFYPTVYATPNPSYYGIPYGYNGYTTIADFPEFLSTNGVWFQPPPNGLVYTNSSYSRVFTAPDTTSYQFDYQC